MKASPLRISAIRLALLALTLACLTFAASQKARAQNCPADFPNYASIAAARAAIDAGSTDVALSPAGCARYKRTFANGEVTHEEVTFDNLVLEIWEHSHPSLGNPGPSPLPPLPIVVSASAGVRDLDADGFYEWRANLVRILPLGSIQIAPQMATQIEKYDPASKQLTQRVTTRFELNTGKQHVTVAEMLDGTLQVTADYDTTFSQDSLNDERTIADGRMTPLARSVPPNVSVPCSQSQTDDIAAAVYNAASNGGACLRQGGNPGLDIALARLVVRPFRIHCERGMERRGHLEDLDDPRQPFDLWVNLDVWEQTNSNKESLVFHEMLHDIFGAHDPGLQGVRLNDDPRFRELDRVSACNSLCYNPSVTKCDCAKCLQKDKCDSPCDSKAACVTTQRGGWCNCPSGNHTWYNTINACEAACPSGFACFTAHCTPEANACKPP